jgi:hypothetical protein
MPPLPLPPPGTALVLLSEELVDFLQFKTDLVQLDISK